MYLLGAWNAWVSYFCSCGADSKLNKAADPSNCTVGPVNPLYWYQQERINVNLFIFALTKINLTNPSQMFEGTYDAPTYNARYGFPGGRQQNLFQDATVGGVPAPVSASSGSSSNSNASGNASGNSSNNSGNTQSSSVSPGSNYDAQSSATPQATSTNAPANSPAPVAVVASPNTTVEAATTAAETPAATRKW